MELDGRDGAAVRIPPPLVYLGAVIGGVLLQAFVLRLPVGMAPLLRVTLAALATLAGVSLMAGAVGLFRSTGQDPKPWKSTPEILTGGVYRFTRNPMYLGMALLQTAIGVGLANGWVLLLVVPVIVVIHFTAIRYEEAYLERKFGSTYLEYRSSVRRWF